MTGKKPGYRKNILLLLPVFILLLFILLYSRFARSTKPLSINDFKIIPKNQAVHVPEPNEIPREQGLAIPKSVRESSKGGKNKLRTFEIVAKNSSFSVNKIIVNQNDIVSINFTSDDGAYDLTFPALGVSQNVKPKENKSLEFQAIADGTFVFACQTCDGSRESMKGILIVVPKS